jgi:uncharacterized protein
MQNFEKKLLGMLKELFIDRKIHLKNLENGLEKGKDYILIAPRRYGKTTLAQKVLHNIGLDSRYSTIHIDIMRYSGSVQSVAEGIVESCLNTLGVIGKLKLWLRQIEFSFQMKLKYGDLEIDPLLQLIRDKNDEWLLLEQSLELIEKIAIKTNKQIIVFFDEFGEISYLGERSIKIFRSVIQLQKHVNYLFAGSQETLMSKIFVEKSGAFYRFGELIFLKEFDKKEVVEYLVGMKLSYEVIDAILESFNCHPYYTAKIIKDGIVEPRHLSSLESFLGYLNNNLFISENGYLELQLSKIKERSHALDIILNISMGIDPYSTTLISKQIVYTTLKNLENAGFLIHLEKGKYQVADPLLKLYLSH